MILCVGATPAVQRVMIFRKLVIDAVNRATTTLDGAAGKSINVAKVLKELGEEPLATGFLGGDRGDFLRGVLQTKGIASDFVSVQSRTRQCVTVIDQSADAITELVEESSPVAAGDYEQLAAIIRRRMPGCRAVVMSGTITPGGPTDFYRRCVQWALEAGPLPVVDAQGAALIEALKAGPGLVKPNRLELAATVGRELADEESVIAAMRDLSERDAQRVVVTAGVEPVLAFEAGKLWRIHTPKVPICNPIGSGDAFTAGLVWRLLRGDDLGEACRWGAAAGAANVLTPLAGELDRGEVQRLASQVTVERLC
jgi:tagatose 6-phosphate kinase